MECSKSGRVIKASVCLCEKWAGTTFLLVGLLWALTKYNEVKSTS